MLTLLLLHWTAKQCSFLSGKNSLLQCISELGLLMLDALDHRSVGHQCTSYLQRADMCRAFPLLHLAGIHAIPLCLADVWPSSYIERLNIRHAPADAAEEDDDAFLDMLKTEQLIRIFRQHGSTVSMAMLPTTYNSPRQELTTTAQTVAAGWFQCLVIQGSQHRSA